MGGRGKDYKKWMDSFRERQKLYYDMLKHANEHFYHFRTQKISDLTWKIVTSDCTHDHHVMKAYCKCSCVSVGGDSYMRNEPEVHTVNGPRLVDKDCRPWCEEGDGQDKEVVIFDAYQEHINSLYNQLADQKELIEALNFGGAADSSQMETETVTVV